MDTDALKKLAAQLGRPEGEDGIIVANNMHETNIGMTRHAIANLQVSDHSRILELGHGNCGHLGALLSEGRNITYYGLEISELMHREAQQHNREYTEQGRAVFGMYDGHKIPFPDQHFDRIFTVNTIYFWQEPGKLLEELYRVLQPGGLLNITFAHKEFMQQLPFTSFGFTLYDIRDIELLVASTAFRYIGAATHTETIQSKTGETVDRTFSTVTLSR